MTLIAAGFPGTVNDQQWATLLDLRGRVDGTRNLDVSAAAGDRSVNIAPGTANLGGVYLGSTETETIQLDPNPSSHPRRDIVLARASWSTSTVDLWYRTGTPSGNPQPPWGSLERDPGDFYEVALAVVDVGPGQGALSSGDITDVRVPPQSGFYRIPSIDRAPREEGVLFYYTAEQALYVVDNGNNVELTSKRTNAFDPLPNPPPNWDGIVRYVRANRWVSVNVDIRRTGSTTDGNTVILGVLPQGYRPPAQWFDVVFNPTAERSFTLAAQPDGQVLAVSPFVGTGQRLRGSVTFPVD